MGISTLELIFVSLFTSTFFIIVICSCAINNAVTKHDYSHSDNKHKYLSLQFSSRQKPPINITMQPLFTNPGPQPQSHIFETMALHYYQLLKNVINANTYR